MPIACMVHNYYDVDITDLRVAEDVVFHDDFQNIDIRHHDFLHVDFGLILQILLKWLTIR